MRKKEDDIEEVEESECYSSGMRTLEGASRIAGAEQDFNSGVWRHFDSKEACASRIPESLRKA